MTLQCPGSSNRSTISCWGTLFTLSSVTHSATRIVFYAMSLLKTFRWLLHSGQTRLLIKDHERACLPPWPVLQLCPCTSQCSLLAPLAVPEIIHLHSHLRLPPLLFPPLGALGPQKRPSSQLSGPSSNPPPRSQRLQPPLSRCASHTVSLCHFPLLFSS